MVMGRSTYHLMAHGVRGDLAGWGNSAGRKSLQDVNRTGTMADGRDSQPTVGTKPEGQGGREIP